MTTASGENGRTEREDAAVGAVVVRQQQAVGARLLDQREERAQAGRVVEVGTVEVGAVVPGALELGLMKELASQYCNISHDVTYMHCE